MTIMTVYLIELRPPSHLIFTYDHTFIQVVAAEPRQSQLQNPLQSVNILAAAQISYFNSCVPHQKTLNDQVFYIYDTNGHEYFL